MDTCCITTCGSTGFAVCNQEGFTVDEVQAGTFCTSGTCDPGTCCSRTCEGFDDCTGALVGNPGSVTCGGGGTPCDGLSWTVFCIRRICVSLVRMWLCDVVCWSQLPLTLSHAIILWSVVIVLWKNIKNQTACKIRKIHTLWKEVPMHYKWYQMIQWYWYILYVSCGVLRKNEKDAACEWPLRSSWFHSSPSQGSDACCVPTCGSTEFAVCKQEGFVADPNQSSAPCDSGTCDLGTCCQPTCASHDCTTIGFVLNEKAKTDICTGSQCSLNCLRVAVAVTPERSWRWCWGVDVALSKTFVLCKMFWGGDSQCCEPTCASVICEPNFMKNKDKFSATCPNGQCDNAFCCEPTCASFKDCSQKGFVLNVSKNDVVCSDGICVDLSWKQTKRLSLL